MSAKADQVASSPSEADAATVFADPPEGHRHARVGDFTGETEADAPAPAHVMGIPVAMFMKGGTPTHAHQMMVAASHADAERRRDVAAAERRIASVPLDQGGGKILGGRISDPQRSAAYVLLTYCNQKREPLMFRGQPLQCLADIMTVGDDLALMIFCLACKKRGEPLDHSIMRILRKNRSWHLDTRTTGELIVFDGAVYRSAGTIQESERFECVCGWAARIDRNQIIVEGNLT